MDIDFFDKDNNKLEYISEAEKKKKKKKQDDFEFISD